MTVDVAVAAVAPVGPEGKHGHCRETSVAAAPVAAACYRRETSVAAAAAAAEACHRRETSVAVAAVAAACHRRKTSVAAAPAAAEACHRREIPYRRGVPPAHPPPAIVSQLHGSCVESRRNGWCFLDSGGSVGGRPKSLFSRHRNVPGAGRE